VTTASSTTSFQFPGASGYVNGDFNFDGVIDAGDYGLIDNSFQTQGATDSHLMAVGTARAAARVDSFFCDPTRKLPSILSPGLSVYETGQGTMLALMSVRRANLLVDGQGVARRR
jgi:hypothetical protein